MERSAIASTILMALIGCSMPRPNGWDAIWTLARFRVDLTLCAELSEIDGEDDFTPLGRVPLAWAKPRMLGSAEHDGKYAAEIANSAKTAAIAQRPHPESEASLF
jgi:hypothetical protein